MVSHIMGGTQAKGTWKQDPEANIYAQEGIILLLLLTNSMAYETRTFNAAFPRVL